MLRRAALVTLCVLGWGLVSSCAERHDDRSVVVLYYSVDEVYARPIIEAFEHETGIRVDARTDTEATKTTGLVGRLRLEQDAPVADVFWSSEPFMTEQLAREGVLESMRTEALDAWPVGYRAPDYSWYGLALRSRVIVFNTNLVAGEDAPGQMRDLTETKWKGRIAMARPEFGTTRGHMAMLVALWGDDGARAWLAGLKANRVLLLDGNSAVVRAVATGEAAVGLTDTDDVFSGQRNGWPIDLVYVRHDLGASKHGVMTIPNTVARVKDGPNPDNAARLMEFLMSEQVERLLAESDSHNYPVRATLRSEFGAYEPPDSMPLGIGDATDAMDDAMEACRDILGG